MPHEFFDQTTITRSLMVPMAIGHHSAEVARRIDAARGYFPALPADEAAWNAASFLAGTPEHIIARLEAWRAAGLQRVLLQMLDQEDIPALELFAEKVLPALS